jgi:crotonobetainyl-CoA:carnitine CoA-transferase CaiB-like acyl-CoA transferase
VGEHTHELLVELGYDAAQMDALAQARVILPR